MEHCKKGTYHMVGTDKELIHKIADVNYEEGMNTFEFLSSTGYYTVSPRPESCKTLFTNYNIQTSGVVIGENIESHVFALNLLGNTVDIAVNHISKLHNYCMELEKELNDIRNKQNWFDISYILSNKIIILEYIYYKQK